FGILLCPPLWCCADEFRLTPARLRGRKRAPVVIDKLSVAALSSQSADDQQATDRSPLPNGLRSAAETSSRWTCTPCWPCPISPDTSDGMIMPGEKDDDTQQK